MKNNFFCGILILSALCIDTPVYSSPDLTAPYSMVFFYVGDRLPDYLRQSIYQARLFNPRGNIFVITNEKASRTSAALISKLERYNVTLIKYEDLKRTEEHNEFCRLCDQNGLTDYWRFTTERFFCIDELIRKFNLKDVFQIECDVLLYVDLYKYLDVLHRHYPGIALPFENDYVASVSFVYFSGAEASSKLVKFLPGQFRGKIKGPDMYAFAAYKNAMTDAEIDHLPTVCKQYIKHTTLKSQRGDVSTRPWKYWNHMDDWDSLFDNDGIGGYLFDGRWEFAQTLFDPKQYTFKWEKDELGRKIPYAHINNSNNKYRINTLHVFSKKLDKFISKLK